MGMNLEHMRGLMKVLCSYNQYELQNFITCTVHLICADAAVG